MSIDIRYEDQPQNVAVRVTTDPFKHFTDADYEELAKVFPFIQDDTEDRSDFFRGPNGELEEC